MVVGTDIAELLLKNKEEFPYEHLSNSLKSSDQSSGHSDTELKQTNEDNSSDGNQSEELSLSEADITDKFRNFLLYGGINEALGKLAATLSKLIQKTY